MTKKAKIIGLERDVNTVDYLIPDTLGKKFELKNYIEVSSTRSSNSEHTIELKENDIIALQFTDQTEWIGHPEDVQEIYDTKTLSQRSLSSEDYIFNVQITSENASRGIIQRALIKVFSVFSPIKIEEAKEGAIYGLAETYDKKIQPQPGLYQLDSSFNKVEYKVLKKTNQPFLLLLHGTLSTTLDAFQKLNSSNNTWEAIVELYGDRIWALEHYTLSVSPLQNALDFLNACPNECTIDILSHSRGGLIADILAKCDYRNAVTGFSNSEIGILKTKDEEGNRKLMEEINTAAQTKKITVNKVIRVAAPSSGTSILSRRVDHFFNLLLNAASLAFGITNPLYHHIKAFLLDLISQKENPEVLPGLNSMIPESLFQKMMNISGSSVESDLYNIAGDAEVGGLNFDSLKVILANLFYQEANDLVVDTRRMEHGVVRKDGIYKFLTQGSTTNHFNYFSADNSCAAILEALNATKENPAKLFTKELYTEGQRGILLDALSLEGISISPEKITRDVVIIVPGIMGSSLTRNGENQWVDMRKINDGGIVKNLNISATKVEANGIIKKYYNDFAEHLLGQYDVITLQFDWRKSLTEAATKLKQEIEKILDSHNIKIHIVAHSMGGLVVRQLMMDFRDIWNKFEQNGLNKFVMLGTPWLGSYLIMEVLTGHSRRVKQLAAIDFKNDCSDLLKIFWKYDGVLELLPIEEASGRPFWDPEFWKGLNEEANIKQMPDPQTNLKQLTSFGDYRQKVIDFVSNDLKKNDFNNIYYICGQADKTVFDYELKNRFLSRNKKLVYKATSYGDGSVSWETGIPKQLLNSSNLYYTHTSHGELANEDYIFRGISEILSTGSTNIFNTQRPASRGGEVISEIYESPEPVYDANAVVDAIFDIKKTEKTKTESFNVKVIHADLKVASYPVMVGHFFMDLILSSEKALDIYLDNRLSQRLNIGYYPGQIGESEVFFNLKTQPKGAIICGLGSADSITHFLLSKSVKQAVLKYAMFMRDNYTLPQAKKYATGISFVLMGVGYGKLPIEDSIRGILLGVSKANKLIKETGDGLKLIDEIEIINYYESVASEAYFSLTRLHNTDNRIAFNLNRNIIRRAGAKKRKQFYNNDYDWWFNLHISSIKNESEICNTENDIKGFKYYASNSLARVEQEMVGVGLYKINHLLKEMSTSSVWDKRLSKSLFEMLVPNDFKNTFRNQNNLILKLDKYAAQIPWELLHDSSTSETPASVTSSFIRQLVTENAVHYNQVSLNNMEAFVVGDPIYNQKELPQLPAAKTEALWVIDRLKKGNFNVNALINSNAKNIMMELFSKQYKIMHFAGHGIYDPEHCNVGIAIGNNICIDPAMINQIGYVPEFIFINCCYSGVLDAEDDKYSKNRFHLAANIGTQLIEMGVKAIVIAGWAVDDAAARVFAETFYDRMFQGYNFGDAVQLARFECHQNHQQTNTWGAYQCYGNQFYKFRNSKRSSQDTQKYVVASQIHTDLDNLLIAIRDKKENKTSALNTLDTYLDYAQESNLMDATVLEKEAMIYDELGMPDIAYTKYKGLFVYDNGNYSIKALEQYCLVLSALLKNKIKEAKKSEKAEDVKMLINEYLGEIKLLTLAGENAIRLNIVANAYKQTSIYLPKTEEIKHLIEAYKLYGQALEISKDKYDGQYLDAISNMIFIAYSLETHKDNKALIDALKQSNLFKKDTDFKKLEKDFKLTDLLKQNRTFGNVKDLNKFLKDYYKELDDFDKADLDISVLFGMTEISYAILLVGNNNKNHYDQIILKWYKEIFQLLYSPRYINTEIDQIDFLLNYAKNLDVKKCLNFIKTELNKLLK